MIRFLIKSVFWLSLAFIVMPRFFPDAQEPEKPAPAEKPAVAAAEPDTVDRLLANGRTALEIGKVCMDNPSLCQNGASLAAQAGGGFMEGSRGVLDYLSDRFGTKKQAATEPQAAGAIPVPTPRAEALRALDRRLTGSIPARP